ncbi:MAG: DegT/DnrJ/EryC1/StrS family aminotransferase [Chloroflexaceae bacterium]|nr:DegT/DnrJ/EryC1/StrS family aminotransferase [Chloroflexaceae bacterium]
MTTGVISQIPFVDLAAQHAPIAAELEAIFRASITKTDFILGKSVSQFEEAFATYCDAPYAIGIDNGTAALEMLLRAYDIGPGDEVITVANTFIATVLAISSVGATPVLVDIDPVSYNMDPAKLEAAITERTRGIVAVHLYGQPADMDPILEIGRKHNLLVMEDAAQAHGAYYKGKRCGALGDGAAFSFYPAKNLGACGDGGALVVPTAELAERIKMLRNYGQREKYHHVTLGFNHRLDTLQAGILSVKLRHLDGWNAARAHHAHHYNRLLADMPGIVAPTEMDYAQAVWHLYVVRVADRDGLRAYLQEQHIGTGIHYPIPCHLQEAYTYLGYPRGSFPVTEAYADQIVSLPMYAEMTDDMVEYVVEHVHRFISQ